MPKFNNHSSRQERALERKELRESRTNEEQIALILSHGGNFNCKEIRRILSEDPMLHKKMLNVV